MLVSVSVSALGSQDAEGGCGGGALFGMPGTGRRLPGRRAASQNGRFRKTVHGRDRKRKPGPLSG
ncbi:MAG TPA: hypothetical protein VL595_06090, partial [Pseudonocardia sp.]|nr:hypothetical protein [Pseudonocardia sp.]